jgi:predicted TIM-barrel fold metal-dependent hydrolase
LSLKKEWAKERIHHKYQSLEFVLSHVGVVMLLFLAAAVLKAYRPSYDTLDMIVTLSVGAALGAASLQSRRLVAKRYMRELEEVDDKRIDSAPDKME